MRTNRRAGPDLPRPTTHSRGNLKVVPEKHDPEPKQKTRPKKGKPIEIPVPTRKEVGDLMRKVAGKPPSASRPKQK